ncbi:cytochrome c [Methylobacterium radiotolerans]|uniref:cytochrome c n=1 Tax=Methylobacterium radiotolerans TaxID=31998 RepID=UPI0006C1F90C|nr:cytochrome c [Methylobacterium radiotolerans]UIY45339.1 cytochrome c [Methylobacterium radiotolerans]
MPPRQIPTAQFRPAPDAALAAGSQPARENCLTCSSADYVARQPPRKGQAFWDAEVANRQAVPRESKMMKVYRAPVAGEQARANAAYLGAAH